MTFVRYVLPVIVGVVGIVWGLARGFDDLGVEIAVLMVSAGASIYLMNLLLRVGISGDRERDAEDEARDYFDRHGRWPDE